jgi:hypothetical protein
VPVVDETKCVGWNGLYLSIASSPGCSATNPVKNVRVQPSDELDSGDYFAHKIRVVDQEQISARVELKTDALNVKSRNAILRIGAKEGGIH